MAKGEVIEESEKKTLMALILDCDRYGFSDKQTLVYIEKRFRKIAQSTLTLYKHQALELADYTNEFFNYYAKAGFAVQHHKLMMGLEAQLRDTENLLRKEEKKEFRDEGFIIKLKYLHMEQTEKFRELAKQTPITAEMFQVFKKYQKDQDDKENKTIGDVTENDKDKELIKEINDVEHRRPDKVTDKRFKLY